jgi:mono/diheme cytochrome c family protein
VANIPAATTVPASTPVLTPTPVSTNNPSQSPALGGAALYAANCEGCHGPLATSSKTGITSTRLSDAISSDLGGMGSLSSLTSAEQQAIVTALTPATTAPTPTTVADGVSLYGSSCSGCHGALASSGKAGATVSRIQTAINNNTGGMGYLISLNLSQITAIASALTTVTPTSTPAPTAVCGSCHSIPPANGQHSRHLGKGVACATCHGTGYSTTSFNSSTHNNGIKNIASTIGWNSTSRSCSNSCHGTEPW